MSKQAMSLNNDFIFSFKKLEKEEQVKRTLRTKENTRDQNGDSSTGKHKSNRESTWNQKTLLLERLTNWIKLQTH